jgi:hypothetical protein
MRLITRAVLILSAVALAFPAAAQLVPGGGGTPPAAPSSPSPASGLITQFNAAQFAPLVTSAGFQATAGTLSDNKTPVVNVQFWPNTTSGLLGTLCETNGACPAYSILTVLPNQTGIGDPWTDAWNDKFSFVKAVKNGSDLIFIMDVVLGPGVSGDYVKTTVSLYKAIVDQAQTFNPAQP